MDYKEFKLLTMDDETAKKRGIDPDEILKADSRGEGDDIQYYITGVMSGPDLDLQADVMMKSSLDQMVDAINNGIYDEDGDLKLVPLRSGHEKEWEFELGWFTKAWLDEQNNMWVEAELDPLSTKAMELYKRLQRDPQPMKKQKLGFSIGGKVLKARRLFDAAVQRTVRYIDAIYLFEGSVTSRPAYAPSFAEVVMKSVDWNEVFMEETMPKKIENVEETLVATEESVPVEKTEETPAEVTESSEVAVEKATETEAPVATALLEVDSPDFSFIQKSLDAQNEVLKDYDETFKSYGEVITALQAEVSAVKESTNTTNETLKRIEGIETALTEVLKTVTEIAVADADRSLTTQAAPVQTVQEYLNKVPANKRMTEAVAISMATRQQLNSGQ
jgi:hypothetical protein